MMPDKSHDSHDFDRRFVRQGSEFMKEGAFFEDAPEWTIRIGDCDDVHIRGITVANNQLILSNDGIYCTTSRNITISDCNITVGDDAIIVSGLGYDPLPGSGINPDFQYGNKTGYAENISVSNCVLLSSSACVRVG